MRAGKNPFTTVGYEDVLQKNILGTNSGNLIFAHAAHKTLLTDNVKITHSGYTANSLKAEEINEKYDYFVLPFANAFRKSFEGHLKNYTKLIKKIKIPVVVLGVGAQTDLKYNMEGMSSIDESVKEFVGAVLDKSASIGVRGELTHAYLKKLGFNDVDIIGCPSLFLHGPDFRIDKKKEFLDENSNIAINISPYVKSMGDIAVNHFNKYKNLVYIPQDQDSMKRMVWGEKASDAVKDTMIPIHINHPAFQENKVRYFVDPVTWIDYLKNFDFSFGTRIHGNITSLLAGTPAMVFAHDSRTLELARYFEIPHKLKNEIKPDVDAAELYQEADFSKFNSGHAERFDRYVSFLDKNGIDHIYKKPQKFDFDKAIGEISFPNPVEVQSESSIYDLKNRLGWLKDRSENEMATMKKRVSELEKLIKNGGLKAIDTSDEDACLKRIEQLLTEVEMLMNKVNEPRLASFISMLTAQFKK